MLLNQEHKFNKRLSKILLTELTPEILMPFKVKKTNIQFPRKVIPQNDPFAAYPIFLTLLNDTILTSQ